ncbi:DEAD/DEAH box helicase family protein [Aeromonas sp. Y311-2]|uniref:DEAD/DEAH box helicase family protein n=1 Tax=Aeromonas sp. Y311-2 TaxID=2990507 RepID=UPI0022E3A177|nr:DEAD/DEAH box helicase family protein [Aeromonas sp. Y311-2]
MSFLNATNFLDFLFETTAISSSGHAKTVIARTIAQKIDNNIEAIKIVKQGLADGTLAVSPHERAILAQYAGWGQLAGLFEPEHPRHVELKALVTPAEFSALEASVLTSYYTADWLIDAMFRAVSRLGVHDGCMLDFAAGSGRFLNRQPATMATMKRFAVELDGLTGNIARMLNPNAKIYINQPFEHVKLPNSENFSLVIGNPPYSSVPAKDRAFGQQSLHNYFLLRGLTELHRGGLMAVVVSSWVMDSKDNDARLSLAARGELIAACRLPNSVFKSEGANVVTDILIFQSCSNPEESPVWLDTVEQEDENGGTFRINRLFAERPDLVAGSIKAPTTFNVSCAVDAPNDDLAVVVGSILDKQTTAPIFFRKANIQVARKGIVVAPAGLADVGPYEFCQSTAGELLRRVADVIGVDGQKIPTYQEIEFKSAKDSLRVTAMLRVKKILATLITSEQEDAPESTLRTLRADLNATYDRFISDFGPFHAAKNKSVLGEDPWYYRLRALEVDYVAPISPAVATKEGIAERKEYWEKGSFFKRRAITPTVHPTSAETLSDAVLISVSFKGYVDLAYIRDLVRFAGTNQELLQLLANERLAYLDPSNGKPVIAAKYLSGFIPAKLKAARIEANINPLFETNVAHLMQALPTPVKAVDIFTPINSRWLPRHIQAAFIRHLAKNPSLDVNVTLVDDEFYVAHDFIPYLVLTSEWGTQRRDMSKLIIALLNNRTIEVRDPHPTNPGATVPNNEETMAAQHKAEEIKAAWEAWVLDDAERRNEIEVAYNEKFNGFVAPKYDGSRLPLAGSALELFRTQRNAIARIIHERATLIDHAVGAGKTYVMIGAASELRRINSNERIIMVAPNHLVAQHATAAQMLFPGMSVFVLDKKMMSPATRRTALARLAITDFDLCIIPLSVFGLIPAPHELQVEMLEEEIDHLRECLSSLEGARIPVRRMQSRIQRKEADLAELINKHTDDMLDFESLRISSLIVDESHFGKNLCYASSLQNVAGMGQASGSKRAFDLYVKSRAVLRSGGRYVEATGTPILNSVIEAHRHLRVLAEEFTQSAGLTHFDAFSAVFAQPVSDYELSASGRGYKLKTRISTFTNLTELQSIYSSFADVITSEQLPDVLPKLADGRSAIPPLTGGKILELVIEPNIHQERGFAEIVRAYANIDSRQNNPLKLLNQGRMLSLDARLVYPDAPDYRDSKINTVARYILQKYQSTKSIRGTQIVFMDRSVPARHRAGVAKEWADLFARANQGDEEAQDRIAGLDELELTAMTSNTFSLYDELVEKLVKGGVARNEIAVIHDYRTDARKEALRDMMNDGQIRILLGSTELAGSGLNINRRLVSLIHFDLPYRPGDLAQRAGRIERQGSLLWANDPNFTIDVVAPITRRSLDAWQLGLLHTKQRFISLFRQLDNSVRHYTEQNDAIDYAELSAIVADDPRILEHVRGKAKLRKLEAARNNWFRNRVRLEDQANLIEQRSTTMSSKMQVIRTDATAISATSDEFLIQVDGESYTKMGSHSTNSTRNQITTACAAAGYKFLHASNRVVTGVQYDLAQYRGATLVYEKSHFPSLNFGNQFTVRGPSGNIYELNRVDRDTINAVMLAFVKLVDNLPQLPRIAAAQITTWTNMVAEYRAEAAKPFANETELCELLNMLRELERALTDDQAGQEMPVRYAA